MDCFHGSDYKRKATLHSDPLTKIKVASWVTAAEENIIPSQQRYGLVVVFL
jgi:hypothetical protein